MFVGPRPVRKPGRRQLAFADMRTFFDEHGNLKPIKELVAKPTAPASGVIDVRGVSRVVDRQREVLTIADRP